MVEYAVVQATEEHARELARNIRPADAKELWAAYHMTPLETLLLSVRVSRDTKAGLADGEVMCMFGIYTVTDLSSIGYPWLLGAKKLSRHARAFLRRNVSFMAQAREEFDLLFNFVDARNKAAIRWLGWLGFEVAEPRPYGIEQLPFHYFEMRAN